MARGSFTLQPCSCMGSLSEPVLTFPFSLQNFKSCLAREVFGAQVVIGHFFVLATMNMLERN